MSEWSHAKVRLQTVYQIIDHFGHSTEKQSCHTGARHTCRAPASRMGGRRVRCTHFEVVQRGEVVVVGRMLFGNEGELYQHDWVIVRIPQRRSESEGTQGE